MPASIVYDNVAEDANLKGQLFADKKFWVAVRVPFRKSYVERIKSNGGEIVALEKKADYLIADHIRAGCPPGSLSYTFIDDSIKKREIQNPENHRAGPPLGMAREVGSSSRPTKGSRAAYTADEDRILYKWVRDAEIGGGLASGNEIYKQLEAKYPRHTWQSWRDRYLKQLRDKPPSAFNIPDNAPPSPPSDEPVEPPPAPKPKKKPTAAQSQVPSLEKASGSTKNNNTEIYTVDDFEKLFSKENWEQLYAAVEVIMEVTPEDYLEGWQRLSEENSQTAEQWRQYFEKVVHPQWKRDPPSKREKIKKQAEQRNEEKLSQDAQHESDTREESIEKDASNAEPRPSSPNLKPSDARAKESNLEDERFELYLNDRRKGKASRAYVHFAQGMKWTVWNEQPGLDYTGLHTLLMSEWDALSAEQRAPYFAREAAERSGAEDETAIKSPQVWLSSSTAVHETPKYITEAYEKALKRIREGDNEFGVESATPRQKKRIKSESISPPPEVVVAIQPQTIEISSEESSTTNSQLPQDEDMEDATQTRNEIQESVEREESDKRHSPAELPGSDLDINGLGCAATPKGIEPLGSSDFPSNTPTPRAPRHKAPAFDTQSILSSPSQGASLSALPQPIPVTQDLGKPRDRSPALSAPSSDEPESEASTTHSLKEFRHSLNESNHPRSAIAALPRPTDSSPPPSSPASMDSGDPDPPLEPEEFDIFFEEQHKQGFTDEFVAASLRHTRFRPDLAEEVLAAWKDGKPLPNKRGVWSKEDDEDVESGDGVALARLERKHTCDGWGGVTERLRFLEQCRSRGQRHG